jgi:hypothetical protein
MIRAIKELFLRLFTPNGERVLAEGQWKTIGQDIKALCFSRGLSRKECDAIQKAWERRQ